VLPIGLRRDEAKERATLAGRRAFQGLVMSEPIDLSAVTKSPSLASLRLSLRLRGGEEQRGATGFLWKHEDGLYLITNWHCITGWHPTTNDPLDRMGFWPEIVVVSPIVKNGAGEAVRQELILELRNDEGSLWLEHPSFGQNVDVAAIKLPTLTNDLVTIPANEVPQQQIKFMVADDAFILGFPDISTDGFPIWKRASLATEPYMDQDGLPKVLVDTATRSGMSGAPVYVIQRGVHRLEGNPKHTMGGHGQRFLGVYSSRIGDELEGFQLGEVWKERVINEIIAGGTNGNDPRA
jgi:hypothetical protein